MSPSRHGIFSDAESRSEKARYEVERRIIRSARHNHTPRRQSRQLFEIGLESSHRGLALHLDQVVERILGRIADQRANRLLESRWSLARLRTNSREIQHDLPTLAPCGEKTTPRLEARIVRRPHSSRFPKNVRSRQRRVPAEVNLDGGREPAQPKGVAFGKQERCLRQIHFACNELHPSLVHRLVQEAHRRRVAGEWLLRKGIHYDDRLAHVLYWEHSSLSAVRPNRCSARRQCKQKELG